MAYSATLIPHLESEDAELHATREETSWIGEISDNDIVQLTRSDKREDGERHYMYKKCEKR